MTEPIATPAAAGAAATAITLSGSILGMQYDALTIAFIGGIAAMMHLPPMPSHVRKFLSVAISAVMGALGSPLAVAAATSHLEWVRTVDDVVLRLISAFTIALFAQVAIPVGMAVFRRKGEAV